MGMFDKDKDIGLIVTKLFNLREPFIVYGVAIKREDFPTNLGPTPQSELEVAKLDAPDERYTCTTLASAIATKVREATPDDFPAVVMLDRVETKFGNDALVLQFVKPYNRAGDTPS